jgi:hypothetical protein
MNASAVTSTEPSLLTAQFLVWVADRPRTYVETMEAWRTTCPRMTVWEDAVSAGLVRLEGAGAMTDARVILTPQGRAALGVWSRHHCGGERAAFALNLVRHSGTRAQRVFGIHNR